MRNRSQLRQRVVDEADALRDVMIDVSNSIHAHPELAFKEFYAMDLLTSTLQRYGATVERGTGGLATAFTGTFSGRSEGPTIAFLAEYDALPDIGHACGHNVIAAIAVGAALAARVVLPELTGRVQVIGTPAEEEGGGKVILAERGAFAGVDVAMMVHPSTANSVSRGSLALHALTVEFEGVPAHAAAHPDKGINALDAMILTFTNINALRQHLRSDARVHGIITNGGRVVNVVPEYAAGRFLVRASEKAYAAEVLRKVKQCAEAAGLATGAKIKTTHVASYDNMVPNGVVARLFKANLEPLGYRIQESNSSDRMGSTDMGNVSQRVPSLHPYIGIADREVASHSVEFARAAISQTAEKALLAAAKAMALTAADLLMGPRLIEEAKGEFDRTIRPAG